MTMLIILNGETLTPDPLGAVYWRREETLIVSDLHFEKGSSFASRGVMLPPYDTRTTLMRLGALMRKYKPARVISLGDAFHDGEAETRMDAADAQSLEALMRETDWLWVLGNHDPEPPARFAARCEEELRLGSLVFRHEPVAGSAPGEIAGHLHPCARVVSEGRALRRRCFAVGESRMIMPAMGAYAGGLNILDEAYAPLFSDPVAWVMGAEGVYPIATDNLAPDVYGGAVGKAV
ncbi:MAG: ligase-associated DNA damage response endonuclease PdeM [Parvularculaceae bacterium]